MDVDVTLGDSFSVGGSRALFELDGANYAGALAGRSYDLTADAQRFLFVHEAYPPGAASLDRIEIVENWFAELERLAPTP
jgi:hypothetical protein